MQSAAARNLEGDSARYTVAHDLARFDPRSRVREAVRGMPAHQHAISKPRTKTAARAYMRVSPFAVASFLGASALLLYIVFTCMQISVVNVENNKLANELSKLKNEERQLSKQLDNLVDLGGLEAYAQYELGMVKPEREQIVYIDLSGKDHGVVYEEESFLDSVKAAFSEAWDWVCGLAG